MKKLLLKREYKKILDNIDSVKNQKRIQRGSSLTEEEQEVITKWYLKLDYSNRNNIANIVKGLKGKGAGLYILQIDGFINGLLDTLFIKDNKSINSPVAKEYLNPNVSGIELAYVNPEITSISEIPKWIEKDRMRIRQNLEDKLKGFKVEVEERTPGYGIKRNFKATLVPEEGRTISLIIKSKQRKLLKLESGNEEFNEMYNNTKDYEESHDDYIVLFRG